MTVVVGNSQDEDPCVIAVQSPLNPTEVVLLSIGMITPSDGKGDNLIKEQSIHEARFFTLGWVESYELNEQILGELTNDNFTYST